MPIVALVQMDSRRYALSRPRHDSEFCLHSRPPGWGSRAVRRIPPMLVLIRAGVFAALVTLASIFSPPISIAADKPFERANLAEAAIKLEAQIKSDAVFGRQAGRADPPRARRGVPAQRCPQRHGAAWPARGGRTGGQRGLAEAGARHPADAAGRRTRARAAARSRGNGRLQGLYAHQESRRGGRQPADRRPHPGRPEKMAPGARRAAAVAGNPRGRRGARPL